MFVLLWSKMWFLTSIYTIDKSIKISISFDFLIPFYIILFCRWVQRSLVIRNQKKILFATLKNLINTSVPGNSILFSKTIFDLVYFIKRCILAWIMHRVANIRKLNFRNSFFLYFLAIWMFSFLECLHKNFYY